MPIMSIRLGMTTSQSPDEQRKSDQREKVASHKQSPWNEKWLANRQLFQSSSRQAIAPTPEISRLPITGFNTSFPPVPK
jgi:hypothetical protein